MREISIICTFFIVFISNSASAQTWRDCIRNSIGPGGQSLWPGSSQSLGNKRGFNPNTMKPYWY